MMKLMSSVMFVAFMATIICQFTSAVSSVTEDTNIEEPDFFASNLKEINSTHVQYAPLIEEAMMAINKINGSVYREKVHVISVQNMNVPDASINKVKLHVQETNCTVSSTRSSYTDCVVTQVSTKA